MHENREISSTPWSDDPGRSAKATSRNADMHVPEKSAFIEHLQIPRVWYLCVMNSPLTYPDHLRDENLAEFFLKLIGASVKTALHVSLVWFFDLLP